MNDLTSKKCVPCEGGMPALSASAAQGLLRQLKDGWSLNTTHTELMREFSFKDFYRTMSFVNALAHIANTEDHHPDLEVGYGYCRVTYSTHSIGGLSVNDFICAAKLDRL